MLAKKYRLTAEKDFARLFSRGKTFNSSGVSMRIISNRLAGPRIGFVISTKVSKRAVVRNLLKRRMRESVRPLLGKLIPRGIDVAFIARPEAVGFDFDEVDGVIRSLLERAGVIRREWKGQL